MDILSLALGGLAGLGLGSALTLALARRRDGSGAAELASLREENVELNRQNAAGEARRASLEEVAESAQSEKARAHAQAEAELRRNAELAAKVASFETEKRALEGQLRLQRENMEELRRQTKSEFELLAANILESKSKVFNEQAEKNLETLLKPLREKIGSFEQRVEASYSNEAKERFALKAEIERLVGLNDRMTRETQSLTQALKGDSKVQGDWGELVLERILEASGLREGHEYTTQTGHVSEDGERYRPDVIIRLPEDKHIVIDSKVSLTAYESCVRSDDEAARAQALAAHLRSLQKHVDELGDKHYSRLKGLRSPEFVFLFVPIEPAYLLAMQNDGELAVPAWKKGVAIVTATTLLTSLRTVEGIWRLENQNRNAQEIANEGARLYDKFVGFLEDFERLGKVFESGQATYASALGKLREGPGNVFRKVERLRELGAAPTKRIKADLLES